MAEDKVLKCKDCGEDFVFTAGEQDFYAEKGFQNAPSRCPACRSTRRNTASAGPNSRNRRSDYGSRDSSRTLYRVRCSSCGAETEIPFQPQDGRPVYCKPCYQKTRNSYSY